MTMSPSISSTKSAMEKEKMEINLDLSGIPVKMFLWSVFRLLAAF